MPHVHRAASLLACDPGRGALGPEGSRRPGRSAGPARPQGQGQSWAGLSAWQALTPRPATPQVGVFRLKSLLGSWDELLARPETSILERLRAEGFTESIIDQFFRPFLGGIFFDRWVACGLWAVGWGLGAGGWGLGAGGCGLRAGGWGLRAAGCA